MGGHLNENAVEELLNKNAMKEFLSHGHTTHLGIPQTEANDPRVVQEHKKMEGEIIIQAHMLAETKKNYQNLADSHWVVVQHGDMDWLRRKKDDHQMLDKYLVYFLS